MRGKFSFFCASVMCAALLMSVSSPVLAASDEPHYDDSDYFFGNVELPGRPYNNVSSGKLEPESVVSEHGKSSRSALHPNDEGWRSGKQIYLRDIYMEKAWPKATGGRRIYVAVVDSGIDTSHPDLARNIGLDADGRPGRSFTGTDDMSDSLGHGTSVAGVLGAVGGNNYGAVGVAWDISILNVKIYGSDKFDLTGALEYVLEQKKKGLNIRVVNCSFAGRHTQIGEDYVALFKRLGEAGILVVAASGNDGADVDDEEWKIYPAELAATLDNVISVGATTIADGDITRAPFSNHGSSTTVYAPGDEIYSTKSGSEFNTYWGTSMAAPVISGLAALYFSIDGDATPADFKERLVSTSQHIAGLDAPFPHAGRLLDVSFQGEPEEIRTESSIRLNLDDEHKIDVETKPARSRRNFRYVSSNRDVAEVSSDGLVSAYGPGRATITVVSDNDLTSSIDVFVGEETSEEMYGGGCSTVAGNAFSGLLLAPMLFAVRRRKR